VAGNDPEAFEQAIDRYWQQKQVSGPVPHENDKTIVANVYRKK
jgi:hypothetical protein